MTTTKAVDFVKTYLKSGNSVVGTASILGVKPTAVKSRLKAYQKKGVKLPNPVDVPATNLDIKALNELIKNYKG